MIYDKKINPILINNQILFTNILKNSTILTKEEVNMIAIKTS